MHMKIIKIIIIILYFRYDRRDKLTAESGHRVVLVVQSSGGGCDDRLEAYDGSKCQVNLLGRGLGGVLHSLIKQQLGFTWCFFFFFFFFFLLWSK